jgi:hypothetical protein
VATRLAGSGGQPRAPPSNGGQLRRPAFYVTDTHRFNILM